MRVAYVIGRPKRILKIGSMGFNCKRILITNSLNLLGLLKAHSIANTSTTSIVSSSSSSLRLRVLLLSRRFILRTNYVFLQLKIVYSLCRRYCIKMIMKGDWSAARRPNLQDIISDDLNIEVWSAMMKTTLTEKGLWDVVANEIPPDPSKIPELAAKIQAEELCNWRELAREDMKALQILQSSLTDSVFRMTLSAASAKDLWDMLNEVPDHVVECFVDDNSPVYENVWKISSTNSNHITSYEKFFTTLDRSRKAMVRFTTGDTTMAEGIGDVTIMTQEGKKTIKNVIYVPGVVGNALSVSQMLRSGFEVRMDRERCTIWDRRAGNYFGETMLGERGFCLRLDVIEGYFQSKKRKFTEV